jgi:hypothetical protein
LIFDGFKSRAQTLAFRRHVELVFARKTWLCETQEEAYEIDPFPFQLFPPIILVARRDDYEGEDEIEESVKSFGGLFAGT